jgi:metallo-beta-lactamase class B
MVQDQIVNGVKKLGMDPAQIKYIIVSHGHNDHYLGARYLQDTYHPHIIMSEVDWNFMEKDDTSADKKPKRDMVATDGMKLTLGDTTLTMYITPGHTPGTISTLIPVRDGNQKHLASIWAAACRLAALSLEKQKTPSFRKAFQGHRDKSRYDVYLSSHTVHDKTLDK